MVQFSLLRRHVYCPVLENDIYECCRIEEPDLYEIFRFLVGNNFTDTGYHWGMYVIFLDWVSRTKGDVMVVAEHLLSILYLISAWVRAECGPRRTPSE